MGEATYVLLQLIGSASHDEKLSFKFSQQSFFITGAPLMWRKCEARTMLSFGRSGTSSSSMTIDGDWSLVLIEMVGAASELDELDASDDEDDDESDEDDEVARAAPEVERAPAGVPTMQHECQPYVRR